MRAIVDVRFMGVECTISPVLVRRLVLTRQRLAGPRPPANSAGIMDVMRDIGYLQFDPMRVVAPSHLLVLWSRIGKYDLSDLETLLWKERRLFQDWAQATSIVLMEDYPIFSTLKQSFAVGDSPWANRIRMWVEKNKEARNSILAQIRRDGPLSSDALDAKFVENWRSSGWSAGRNIGMMVTILWAQGRIMIAGRKGNKKIWDLTERFLPKWTSREKLSDNEVFRRAAQKSLRALGIARSEHVDRHYIRRCYGNIKKVLGELETDGLVRRVQIQEHGKIWRGEWFIHAEDLHLLKRLAGGEWEPHTTLLSPFDNLICDRQRTWQVFNFRFSFEVYMPKAKRKYGCYVMPILHDDHLIGRLDPVMDHKRMHLRINAVYLEPGTLKTEKTTEAIVTAVEELGAFLKAEKITWQNSL
jgi:uncharacterized protein YcaQ